MKVSLFALAVVLSGAPNEAFVHRWTRPVSLSTRSSSMSVERHQRTSVRPTLLWAQNDDDSDEDSSFAWSSDEYDPDGPSSPEAYIDDSEGLDVDSIPSPQDGSTSASSSRKSSEQSLPTRPLRKQPFRVVLDEWGEEDEDNRRMPVVPAKRASPAKPAFPVQFDAPTNAFPDQGSRMSTVGRGAPGMKGNANSGYEESKFPARRVNTKGPAASTAVATGVNFFAETPEQAEERRRNQDDFWKKPLTTQEAALYRGLEEQQRKLEALQKARLEAELREEARMESLALAARRGQEEARRKALVEAEKREEEERIIRERSYGAAEHVRNSKEKEKQKQVEAEKRMQALAYQRQAQMAAARARAAAKQAKDEQEIIEKAKRRGEKLNRRRDELSQKNDSAKLIEELARQRQMELQDAFLEHARLEEESTKEILDRAARRGAKEKERKLKLERELAKPDSILDAAAQRWTKEIERRLQWEKDQAKPDPVLDAAARRGAEEYKRKLELAKEQAKPDSVVYAAEQRGTDEFERKLKWKQEEQAKPDPVAEAAARRGAEEHERKQKLQQEHAKPDSVLDTAVRRGESFAERQREREEQQRKEAKRLEQLQELRIARVQTASSAKDADKKMVAVDKTIIEAAYRRGEIEAERRAAFVAEQKVEKDRLREFQAKRIAEAQQRGLEAKQDKDGNPRGSTGLLTPELSLLEAARRRGLAIEERKARLEEQRIAQEARIEERRKQAIEGAAERGRRLKEFKAADEAERRESEANEQISFEAQLRGLELEKKRAAAAAKEREDAIALQELEFNEKLVAEQRGLDDLKYRQRTRDSTPGTEHGLTEAEIRGLELQRKRANAAARKQSEEEAEMATERRLLQEAEKRGKDAMRYKEEKLAQARAEEYVHGEVLAEAEIRGMELARKKAEALEKLEALEKKAKKSERRRFTEAEERGIEASKYKEEQFLQARAEDYYRDAALAEAELRGLELEKKKVEAKMKLEAMERQVKEAELLRRIQAEERGIAEMEYRAKMSQVHAKEEHPDEVSIEAKLRGFELEKKRAAAEAAKKILEDELAEAEKTRRSEAELRGLEAMKYRAEAEKKALEDLRADGQVLGVAMHRGEMSSLQRRLLEAKASAEQARSKQGEEFTIELAERRGELNELIKSKQKREKMSQIETKVSLLDEAIKRGEMAAQRRAAEEEVKKQQSIEREEADKRLMADAEKRGQAAAALRAKERAIRDEESLVSAHDEAIKRGEIAAQRRAAEEEVKKQQAIEQEEANKRLMADAVKRGQAAAALRAKELALSEEQRQQGDSVSALDGATKRGEIAALRRAAEEEIKKQQAIEREEANRRLMADAEKRGQAAAALRAKERALREEQNQTENSVAALDGAIKRGQIAALRRAAEEEIKKQQAIERDEANRRLMADAKKRGQAAAALRAKERAMREVQSQTENSVDALDGAIKRGQLAALRRAAAEEVKKQQALEREAANTRLMADAEKRGQAAAALRAKELAMREEQSGLVDSVSALDGAMKRGEIAALRRAAAEQEKIQKALEQKEATKRLMADAEKRGQAAAALRAKEQAMREEHDMIQRSVMEEAKRRGALEAKMKLEAEVKRRESDLRNAKAREEALEQAKLRGLKAAINTNKEVGDRGRGASSAPVGGNIPTEPFSGRATDQKPALGEKQISRIQPTDSTTTNMSMKVVNDELDSDSGEIVRSLSKKIEQLQAEIKAIAGMKKLVLRESVVHGSADVAVKTSVANVDTGRHESVATTPSEASELQDADVEAMLERAHEDFVAQGQLISGTAASGNALFATTSVNSSGTIQGTWPQSAWQRVEAEKERRAIVDAELVADGHTQNDEEISVQGKAQTELNQEIDDVTCERTDPSVTTEGLSNEKSRIEEEDGEPSDL